MFWLIGFLVFTLSVCGAFAAFGVFEIQKVWALGNVSFVLEMNMETPVCLEFNVGSWGFQSIFGKDLD